MSHTKAFSLLMLALPIPPPTSRQRPAGDP